MNWTGTEGSAASAAEPSGFAARFPQPPGLEPGVLTFEVHNTWTSIHQAHPYFLDLIDRETRYPTQTAEAIERGFRPPDAHDCQDCGATGRQPGTAWACQRCRGRGYLAGWDGWVRLLHRTKTRAPYFPTGLLYRATGILQHLGTPFRVLDQRVRPSEGMPEFARGLKLRDYQVEAVEAAVRAGRGVLDMPPRSGKTRTMVEIVRRLALPTIWMAPTDQIVRQTHELFDELFGQNFAHRQIGAKGWEDAAHRHVVVATAATAASLPAEFYASRQVLVIDEYHHAASKSYWEIAKLCDHVYHRYGMTGTFFRSGHDLMALHGILSNTVYRVGSDELQRRGHLVPTRVVFLPVLSEPLRGVPRGSTYQQGVGKLGIQEHEYRQQLAANVAAFLDQQGRRVLVLVSTKRQGRDLQDRIAAQIRKAPEGCRYRACEFVSTDIDRPNLNQILDSFRDRQEVRVLVGTSLLGEGVDLPVADALVYARGEKAEVSLTQNAYRVGTAVPGKAEALIVDFADRHHQKLLEHSLERLRVYHEEPTFTVEVLRDPGDFWGRAKTATP